jgi:hypothetical protein
MAKCTRNSKTFIKSINRGSKVIRRYLKRNGKAIINKGKQIRIRIKSRPKRN